MPLECSFVGTYVDFLFPFIVLSITALPFEAVHILCHTNFGIFRHAPTPCHTLSQIQNYPHTPNV